MKKTQRECEIPSRTEGDSSLCSVVNEPSVVRGRSEDARDDEVTRREAGGKIVMVLFNTGVHSRAVTDLSSVTALVVGWNLSFQHWQHGARFDAHKTQVIGFLECFYLSFARAVCGSGICNHVYENSALNHCRKKKEKGRGGQWVELAFLETGVSRGRGQQRGPQSRFLSSVPRRFFTTRSCVPRDASPPFPPL